MSLHKKLSVERLIRDHLFSAIESDLGSVVFVQVGANDGEKNDPLYKHILGGRWRGMLIEPNPAAFDLLKKTYAACTGLSFMQCAISDSPGTATLYVPVTGSDRLASLDPTYLTKYKHKIGDARQEVTVQVRTLTDVLSESSLQRVDVLCIDTEGYDWRVLSSADLRALSPKLVYLEQIHLNDTERKNVRETFSAHNLVLVENDRDWIGVEEHFYKRHLPELCKKLIDMIRAARAES